MTDQNIDTKKKIMEIARVLFAHQGFEGTSVRDIARSAEVNVASVNYHFSSKEKLFLEILNAGYIECAQEVKRLYEVSHGNLESTLVELFKYYMANSPDLLSHFKMMMSSQHSHNLVSQGTDDGYFGPPGGSIITEAIKKEVGEKSEEEIVWAMRTLFSHVSHLALIHACVLKNNTQIAFSSDEDHEKSIRRVVRLVLSDLKNSP
ncbi:TetR/AcrR family transcriptional regulator [Peredibacter starrii]|uniref:TetR family transcriptional regulator n=1 Tax=Peredibacter starrii TaxID=28202 RepID=A0AAX4HLA6_9BACT|nr:TetR family transcriptional regulator [Peredibacter starrii]WPU63938.1 TetR family transcriptional regulator [Peredibacter starrii]